MQEFKTHKKGQDTRLQKNVGESMKLKSLSNLKDQV